MQYRKDRKGNDLSVLGYGCMRFTRKGSGIDLEKAEKELMYAIRSGVNYLDTAYIYPGSEAAVGEILHRNHCRENVYIATKLPHYMIKSVEGAEKVFQEELRRLQTDYIDYYLMYAYADGRRYMGKIKKSRDHGMDRIQVKKRRNPQYRIFLSWTYGNVSKAGRQL